MIELFSGIGAQRSALAKAGIPHKVVAISEIDKYALKSYNAMYNNCLDTGETVNLGDIRNVNPNDVPDCDFLTFSSPCQSFSISGKMLGGEKDSGTESSLLWEVEKIISAKRPKYLMLENVKMLVSKRFKHTFDDWLAVLDKLGYDTYWQVLNAKNYGVPQNRERVYAISIRKDVDNGLFGFPQSFVLKRRLKDVLEVDVDERYYLKPNIVDKFVYKPKSAITGVLTLADYKRTGLNVNTNPVGNLNHYNRRPMNDVFGDESISPTLQTMTGGNRQPKVLIRARNKQGYNEAYSFDSVGLDHPNSTQKGSRVTKSVSRTLTTQQDVGVVEINGKQFSIRRLTPKECWRLMGFSDEQFSKAQAVCSNTQLYKQAGNSIVVDVLSYIFENLFKRQD